MAIEMPSQLKNEKFRFILVDSETKRPIEKEWTTNTNYKCDDINLLEKLNKDRSYGVCGGFGNLIIIDSDTEELNKFLEENLPKTFKIQSGSHDPGKFHRYYICEEYNLKKSLDWVHNNNTSTHYGEIQGKGAMVVGPNCKHRSGNSYDIIENIEITSLSKIDIDKVINKFSNVKELNAEEINKLKTRNFKSDNIEEQLAIADVFMPINPQKNSKGEIFGIHPIHGSVTGMNCFINPSKNVFHCFRCDSGGGVSIAIAIKEGIINCSQAKGKLEKESYLKVLKISKEKYGYVDKITPTLTEQQDELSKLENDIIKIGDDNLRRTVDLFLERITKIDSEIFQRYLLGLIARKTKVSKKELNIQLEKIKNASEIKNPVSLSEVLKQEYPEIKYYCNPMLAKNSICMIGGQKEQFKSMLALTMAVSIAGKNKFLNNFEIEEKAKILYYDLENGVQEFHRRVKFLINSGLNIPEEEYFKILFSFNGLNLKKELEVCKDYDIIVLDSYRRFLIGSENDSEITNLFYRDFLKPLRDMGKTIIILMHKRRPSKDADEDNLAFARGSSDIEAQPDIAYNVEIVNEIFDEPNKTTIFIVNVRKSKNRSGLPIRDFNFTVVLDRINKKTNLIFNEYKIAKQPTQNIKIKEKILELLKIKDYAAKDLIPILENEFPDYMSDTFNKVIYDMISESKIFRLKHCKYGLTIMTDSSGKQNILGQDEQA